jgi:hypothetical protein
LAVLTVAIFRDREPRFGRFFACPGEQCLKRSSKFLREAGPGMEMPHLLDIQTRAFDAPSN